MLEDFGGIYSLLNRQSPAGSPCFSGPGPTASSPGASLEPRGGPCFANMMICSIKLLYFTGVALTLSLTIGEMEVKDSQWANW